MAKSSVEIKVFPLRGQVAMYQATVESGMPLKHILKVAEIPRSHYTFFVNGTPACLDSNIDLSATSGSPIQIKAHQLP